MASTITNILNDLPSSLSLYRYLIAKQVRRVLNAIQKYLIGSVIIQALGVTKVSKERKEDIIIAGEESGGLSIKGHIPEKDGILANLLIMEMMAYENKKLCVIHKEFLSELNKKFINDRIDLKLESKDKQEEIINKFKTYSQIGEYKITDSNTMDGLKIYLEDGSWILIRKSGTEPLLRIYVESDKEEKIQELEKIIKQLC